MSDEQRDAELLRITRAARLTAQALMVDAGICGDTCTVTVVLTAGRRISTSTNLEDSGLRLLALELANKPEPPAGPAPVGEAAT